MGLSEADSTTDPKSDPVLFECALARATQDLRRIALSLAERNLKGELVHALTWPVLLEIEEQAFSDLSFQSRNATAVVDALPRIGPKTLPGVDLTGFVDWALATPSLPISYLCVREMLTAGGESGRTQASA
ncbi:hypothetical protein C7H84_29865 [Burkholderia sp. Nafp2/4-1b]|uniref:DUF2471 family protein n=1 Tax=Burkholderia sp. Nafp2/4-1b TaxID=2116686 RepID=UPI000EF93CBB|nr:DUF2471 family protein [Burkholderia sp. Nafp2/4-1b]RKT99764.1 hypothetical protein C7H84_29865 [Burkholderia sp. Nafp2/4-1b]